MQIGATLGNHDRDDISENLDQAVLLARSYDLDGEHEKAATLASEIMLHARADDAELLYSSLLAPIMLKSSMARAVLEWEFWTPETLGEAMIETGRTELFGEWLSTLEDKKDRALALLGAAESGLKPLKPDGKEVKNRPGPVREQ